MPIITMTFPHVNDSVQIGDTTYYQAAGTTNITEMGTVTALTPTTVSTNISGTTTRPTSNDFILFSKDNRSAVSALRGYFAEVKMVNDEKVQCELFDVGTEIFESSK
tara:strand:- start:370 stop:690 length:321 start_codon:yes stop_codon:yes gene_type:complete